MKLITMTEFVLNECDAVHNTKTTPLAPTNHPDNLFNQRSESWKKIMQYANFLPQKLQLEMFVPASELKELPGGEKSAPEQNAFFPELEDKVLFKDLKIIYTDLDKQYYIKKNNGFFVISGKKSMFNNNLTIEDIVHRDLELTDTAVKLIFG